MTSSPGISHAVYVKRHGVHVRRDWERVRRFAEIVESVEGLSTARPLACDPKRGEIVYERLSDPIALSALTGTDEHRALLVRAARLLAGFHRIPVPGIAGLPPREQGIDAFALGPDDCVTLRNTLPSGFFWGDCWQGNVLLSAGELHFIDPLPNRWLFDKDAMTANGGIDLAMLYMSVFFCFPLRRLFRLDVQAHVVAAEEMLAAYLSAAGAHGAKGAIRRLARLIAVRYIETCHLRLPAPIAAARRYTSGRILRLLDDVLDWRQ